MSITYLPRVTVPFKKLMRELLAFPGLTVKASSDPETVDRLPKLVYSGINGHQVSNAEQLAWEWTLVLSLLTQDPGKGDDLADTIYQWIHGWTDWTPTVTSTLGSVVLVDDVSMFDEVGTADLPDNKLVQYSATFSVIVAPN